MLVIIFNIESEPILIDLSNLISSPDLTNQPLFPDRNKPAINEIQNIVPSAAVFAINPLYPKITTLKMQEYIEKEFKKGHLSKRNVNYKYCTTISQWTMLLGDLREKFLPEFGSMEFDKNTDTVDSFICDLKDSIRRLYSDNQNRFEIPFQYQVSYLPDSKTFAFKTEKKLDDLYREVTNLINDTTSKKIKVSLVPLFEYLHK